MSCEYTEYIFDKRANEYFVSALSYGHELDQQLLKKLDIDRGEIAAYLPRDYENRNIYQFSGGGIAKRDHSIECIISTIQDHLIAKGNNVCLIEDALSLPLDDFEKQQGVAVLSFQNEVYFYLENKYTHKNIIEYALTEAEQPNFFVCILTSKPSDDFMSIQDVSISNDKIEGLAIRTEKIILGAYDGEGYLIWHKQKID
jgi:hypothetical protein